MLYCVYTPFTDQEDAESLTCHHLSISYLFQGKPELIPSLQTLALNDAITYDKVSQKTVNILSRFKTERKGKLIMVSNV